MGPCGLSTCLQAEYTLQHSSVRSAHTINCPVQQPQQVAASWHPPTAAHGGRPRTLQPGNTYRTSLVGSSLPVPPPPGLLPGPGRAQCPSHLGGWRGVVAPLRAADLRPQRLTQHLQAGQLTTHRLQPGSHTHTPASSCGGSTTTSSQWCWGTAGAPAPQPTPAAAGLSGRLACCCGACLGWVTGAAGGPRGCAGCGCVAATPLCQRHQGSLLCTQQARLRLVPGQRL
jgi:hypothetical protein